MLIGVSRETKAHENRIGLTLGGARETSAEVMVERSTARAIGFDDSDHEAAGAEILDLATEIFDRAKLVAKAEPRPDEIALLREAQILYPPPDPKKTQGLLDSECSATVTDIRGRLPLLAPMSEVEGCMAAHAGATRLEVARGGRRALIVGVPGVAPGNAAVICGSAVGSVTVPRPVPARGTRRSVQEPDHDALYQPDKHRRGSSRCGSPAQPWHRMHGAETGYRGS